MPIAPPDPHDPPERMYEQARLYYEKYQEARAVIEGIKAHVEPWKNDKRMKIMGEILLGHIARIEKEEAERTQKGGRGA